jgi:Tol biopolymer transport system component
MAPPDRALASRRRALFGLGSLALGIALIGLSDASPAAALANTEVYVVNVDGTGRMNLTHDPGVDGFPALSPGGSALAFVRQSHLWVMSRDGTGQRALADAETCCGAGGTVWRPGGGLLAFTSTDFSSCHPGADSKCVTWQIRTVRTDGSDLVTLVPNNGRNPAWAPGGRFLAYEADVYNAEGYAIRVLDTATLETWTVAPRPGAGYKVFFDPEWSPDRSKLVFRSNGKLVVAGARGDNRQVLGIGSQATWAPGGRRIAFVRKRRPPGSSIINEVLVIGVQGAGLRRLTRGVLPIWSPDGKRIAFIRPREGNLYVMRNDGSHVRRVARGASSQLGPPVWSHDGRRLFYAG